jgi:hypothetical protein
MIAWVVLAWLSMLTLDLPWKGRTQWDWLRIIGPMTWALLLIGPASLALVAQASDVSERRPKLPP